MRWTVVPPVVMGAGLVLIFSSYLWPWLVKSSVYSEENAKRLGAARAELHTSTYVYEAAKQRAAGDGPPKPGARAVHSHGGEHDSLEEAKARFDKAKQEYEAANAELQSARGWRSKPASVLWWSGSFVALLGVAGYVVLKTPWGQQFVEE